MGDLRACLLPVRVLRALLEAGQAGRERVVELVAQELAPSLRPEPFGPIFTRVPGAPLVHDDDPTPDDLDRLLGQDVVPPRRARATWRLVEAVATGMAASTTRAATDRPVGLAPLGLALPEPDGLVVGSWTLTQASSLPSLSGWLEGAVSRVPAGSSAPEVVVFWEPGTAG
ncbi:MAG: hypothetical protein ACRYG2_36475 [Janthinobacterium lividum]